MSEKSTKYILITEKEYNSLKKKKIKKKKKQKIKTKFIDNLKPIDIDNLKPIDIDISNPIKKTTDNTNKNDNLFSKEIYNDIKDELTLIFPLDKNNNKFQFKEHETSDNILNILFPNILQNKKKESVECRHKKDRSIFLNGKKVEAVIENIDDLLEIYRQYGTKYSKDEIWSLDFESLGKIQPILIKLNNMIGLNTLKDKIVHQIIFYLQGLDTHNLDMLHTVIQGKPGVGKTEIAKILGELYCVLGILSKGTFKSVKRADLIGSYLGQTAMKTLKVLNEAKGGVLFIDEAYSLGNDDGKDIYSKECIDTLTAYLSENRDDFICIIAGYREQLNSCFFNYNQGLRRRFPWTYTIDDYTSNELEMIFKKIVDNNKWKSDIPQHFFSNNYKLFKHFGGDMEILFQKSKLCHSKRSLNLSPINKKKIDKKDLMNGLTLFKGNIKKNNDIYGMYT